MSSSGQSLPVGLEYRVQRDQAGLVSLLGQQQSEVSSRLQRQVAAMGLGRSENATQKAEKGYLGDMQPCSVTSGHQVRRPKRGQGPETM